VRFRPKALRMEERRMMRRPRRKVSWGVGWGGWGWVGVGVEVRCGVGRSGSGVRSEK
jgi:hypothetical protein